MNEKTYTCGDINWCLALGGHFPQKMWSMVLIHVATHGRACLTRSYLIGNFRIKASILEIIVLLPGAESNCIFTAWPQILLCNSIFFFPFLTQNSDLVDFCLLVLCAEPQGIPYLLQGCASPCLHSPAHVTFLSLAPLQSFSCLWLQFFMAHPCEEVGKSQAVYGVAPDFFLFF